MIQAADASRDKVFFIYKKNTTYVGFKNRTTMSSTIKDIILLYFALNMAHCLFIPTAKIYFFV